MIDTGAGVVDADYRGPLFVLLYNLSDKDFEGALPHLVTTGNPDSPPVHEGDRIAQLILERIYTPQVLEVEVRLLVPRCPKHIYVLSRVSTTLPEAPMDSGPPVVTASSPLHEVCYYITAPF